MQAPVPFLYRVEDFQDAPDWLQRIFTPLNRFQEQTIACLDNGIQLGVNIESRRYTTDYRTSANYLTGTFQSITFSWTGPDLPSAVLLTRVQHTDQTPFLGSVGVPQWVFNGGYIVIYYLPGLAINKDYTLSFLAI